MMVLKEFVFGETHFKKLSKFKISDCQQQIRDLETLVFDFILKE